MYSSRKGGGMTETEYTKLIILHPDLREDLTEMYESGRLNNVSIDDIDIVDIVFNDIGLVRQEIHIIEGE